MSVLEKWVEDKFIVKIGSNYLTWLGEVDWGPDYMTRDKISWGALFRTYKDAVRALECWGSDKHAVIEQVKVTTTIST